jgi:hypothetical protein
MYAAACSSPCISMHAGGARARPAAAAGAAAWAAHRGALGPCQAARVPALVSWAAPVLLCGVLLHYSSVWKLCSRGGGSSHRGPNLHRGGRCLSLGRLQ